MMNKRRFLAHRMRDLGLLSVIERLARKPGLLVLAYHRIGDPAGSPEYSHVFSATAEGFRSQIEAVRRGFRLLSPRELIDASSGDLPLTEPCAAITFDDGYRDQFDLALPILQDAGASAFFFIPPDLIDRPRPFWWDLVSRIIRQTDRARLELAYPSSMSIDLETTSRDSAITRVIDACLASRPLDEDHLADHLQTRAGVSLNIEGIGRAALMDWEQVATLISSGMGVGSHGKTHRRLTDLDEPGQSEELVSSKRTLEARLGGEVDAISYPYGSVDDYDLRTLRLTREAGYRVGFTFGGRSNRPGEGDPLQISRINVGSADSADMIRARLVLEMTVGRSII